jgi:hypothetical protein
MQHSSLVLEFLSAFLFVLHTSWREGAIH